MTGSWRACNAMDEAVDEVAIVSATLLADVAAHGIPLLANGTRTAALTAAQMSDLGVAGLPDQWPTESSRNGRRIVYVIFQDQQALESEGRDFITIPRPKK
jgi:hypothetical protein